MSRNTLKTIAAACACGSALVVGSGFASATSDLVINVEDSTIRPGSCDENSALVTGRIAIKNQGEDTAELKVTERFTRSLLAVYVPENIDMIAKKSQRRKLDPFDQEGIAFEIGIGVVKKGRNFGIPSTTTIENKKKDHSNRHRVHAIQTALDRIGYDPGTIDGLVGPNTRKAIRQFQDSIGAAKTGTLTASQRRALFDKAGTSDTVGGGVYGAQGVIDVTIYAVVDPYNLVPELNEANNLQAFTFQIDCGQ